MMYFKIDPLTNEVLRTFSTVVPLEAGSYNTKEDSAVNGKPFLVEATKVDVSYDSDTEVREGPTYSYDGTTALYTYTKRAKTQAELDEALNIKDQSDMRSAMYDMYVVLIGLIDALMAKGTLVPTDVELKARQRYQNLKTIVDNYKSRLP